MGFAHNLAIHACTAEKLAFLDIQHLIHTSDISLTIIAAAQPYHNNHACRYTNFKQYFDYPNALRKKCNTSNDKMMRLEDVCVN